MAARSFWTAEQLQTLRALYADTPTRDVAAACGRPVSSVYARASILGLHKSAAFRASPASGILIKGTTRGAAFRFRKGQTPANKGLRRPGWGPGRMRETQFRKGQFPYNRDPEFYVLGALRVNVDGYIDMRVSFEAGAKGWRALHRVLWEDAHGPVPDGHCVAFRNGDALDVCLENLELITRADLARRNSIHRLPKPLASAIQLVGQLKRRIREKQDRGSAQPLVRDARGSARQGQADGSGPGARGGKRGAGDRRLGTGGGRVRKSNGRARRVGFLAGARGG